MPNQSLEPMARCVTPRACARVAPPLAMAHHKTLGVVKASVSSVVRADLRRLNESHWPKRSFWNLLGAEDCHPRRPFIAGVPEFGFRLRRL